MSWLGLIKVFSGFLLAIALLGAGSYYAAQYLIAQFTLPPPKPVFPNDKLAIPKPASAAKPVAAKPTPQPSPSPSPSPKPTEPAGYRARITLSSGLNLRDKPNRDSTRVGGISYNGRVVVLEESQDKEWQRVRIEEGDLEGWIKSGYTERLN